MALVGWLLALLASIAAGVSLLKPAKAPDSSFRSPSQASDEERTLRLALSTTELQNAALRAELDRLLASRKEWPAKDDRTRHSGSAPPPLDSAETSELAARIRDAASRAAAAGDPDSNRRAALALMEAFQRGPESFPALLEAYRAADDPRARRLLLPTLLFLGGHRAPAFLVEQLQSESDPALRRTLLLQSVRYATPRNASEFQGFYLQALQAAPSEDREVRAAAIRGLRHAQGAEVERALWAATDDPDERIRIAAIAALAGRPGSRVQLEEIARRESSTRVREVARCSLTVSSRY